MDMVCLVENHRIADNLEARHGLSLFIALENQSLVFDLGPDNAALDNAATLGLDLTRAAMAIISHGHHDHGDGLAGLLEIHPKVPVFMTRGAGGRFFARIPGQPDPEIGFRTACLASADCRFIDRDTALSPSLSLFTDFDKGWFIPAGNEVLLVEKPDGSRVPDPFDHELALLIREGGKTVLVTGCSHSGILNMVSTVLHRAGLYQIDAVIGGFHLLNPLDGRTEPQERLDRLARDLSAWSNTVFYTGHCTGDDGFSYLNKRLRDQIRPLSTGTRIRI